MKVSVSSYSYSLAVSDGRMTQFDTVKTAKEMGFSAIEFTEIEGDCFDEKIVNAEKIRCEAEKLNFPIIAYLVGAKLWSENEDELRAAIENTKKQVDVANALGAKLFRHDVCSKIGPSKISFDMMLPTIAVACREITGCAERYGIRTCTENHGFIVQDSDRLERLYNAVNHPNYGILCDIGNFVCVDENPVTAVSRVAPYAIHVHAKDMYVRETPADDGYIMTRGAGYFRGAVFGEGDLPCARSLMILKNAGYDGYVTLEYEAGGDCFDGIAKSLSNLTGILKQIGAYEA